MAPPAAFKATRDPVTGQAFMMTEQDFDAYYTFVKKYTAEFQPQTHDEQQMVRTIADTQWRINRANAIECNLLNFHVSQMNNIVPSSNTESQTALTLARIYGGLTKELSRMSLYEKRLNDLLVSTKKVLERTQKARRASHEESIKIAASIRTMRQKQQQTWKPSDDGFEFSIQEIDAHLNRENVVSQAKTFSAARC